MADETEKDQIISWIEAAVGTKTFRVDFDSEKAMGMTADITFVKVSLEEAGELTKEIHLAVKLSKCSPKIRQNFPFIREDFKREILFYDEVIQTLHNFQQEKNIEDPFDAVPKCYFTFLNENQEVIITENLKTKGYELHRSKIPINLQHIKMALKNYAKLHALSLALSDQKPDCFKKVEENYYPVISEKIINYRSLLEKDFTMVIDYLHEAGREDLVVKYEKLVAKEICSTLLDIVDNPPKEKVVLHADCQDLNIFYKYKDEDKKNATNVAFIDFQVSFLHSPVIDLAYYLYSGSSKNEAVKDHFIDILDFYYQELSSFLFQLGSNPNKLFPKTTFKDHWKKYSFFAFHTVCTYLEFYFIDTQDVPTLDDVLSENACIKLQNKDEYLEGLTGICDHYLNFKFE